MRMNRAFLHVVLLVSIAIGITMGSDDDDNQVEDYEYFVSEGICSNVKTKAYSSSSRTNIVKLRCDWKRYMDATQDRSELDELIEKFKVREEKERSRTSTASTRKSRYRTARRRDDIFEIEFVPGSVSSPDPAYKTIRANLFDNMRIKSLSFRDLKILNIAKDAFDYRCCRRDLESLDLTGNSLKRVDEELLENLVNLKKLYLGSNQLQFGEGNFKHNTQLESLDMSNNGLQYLPNNVFANLKDLIEIDLSNNFLKTINACSFNKLLVSTSMKKHYPTKIILLNNQIECNCDIFYMSRYLNLRMNLTCAGPSFYSNKKFDDLRKEDPSERCQYGKMDHVCKVQANEDNNWLISLACILILLVITLALLILTILFVLRIKALRCKLNTLEASKNTGEQANLLQTTAEAATGSKATPADEKPKA